MFDDPRLPALEAPTTHPHMVALTLLSAWALISIPLALIIGAVIRRRDEN